MVTTQHDSKSSKHFYRMGKGESLALVFLILFSAMSFLPVWRRIEVGGITLFGWLMAALMMISPLLTLCVFEHGRRTRTRSLP